MRKCVGYQNKGFPHVQFNYVCNTFIGCTTGRTMTLGDFEGSDDFYASSIQFLTQGGATASVEDPNLGTVKETYVFCWAEDTAAKVRGWYFRDDKGYHYPQNSRIIKAGEAFCVSLAAGEKNATLNFSGQVDNQNNEIKFPHVQFNYIGNCSPVDITLGDIEGSDDFYASSIQFLTQGGATDSVNDPNLGTVKATYVFCWAEDTAAKVRGWYFRDDKGYHYPQNSRQVKAGEAFCVSLAAGEKNASITIPSAL